uniref:G-protein coupled receptors family 2 profile 2 domain-containing protein n=1 Tax=Electrophorus electricus TaxID=8005 RepID=A0AAY5EFP5_ELEEL
KVSSSCSPLTGGTVSRNCTSAGWSQPFPPYHEACSVEDDIPEDSYFSTVKLIYSIGYGASLISLMVAVAILLRLRCARNYIHIQLFFSFILKAASVFIKDATLFASQDTNHCSLSTAACKASVVFCHYCVMSNFSWLLMEAVYLNFLLVSALPRTRRCLWGFALLGWGERNPSPSLGFRFAGCWDINEDSPYCQHVNFMLFMNIIRILIQKLNPRLIQFNNSAQYRRLTKSTLLLIPLFGTHYVVFNFLPDDSSVNLRFCIELCLGSFQVPIAPKHNNNYDLDPFKMFSHTHTKSSWPCSSQLLLFKHLLGTGQRDAIYSTPCALHDRLRSNTLPRQPVP